MKIRTALFGTYVIASAVGLAVLMRFVLAEVRPRYVGSIETTMKDSARLLAASLGQHAKEEWPTVFNALSGVGGGIRLRVEDESGTVIFDLKPTSIAESSSYDYKRYKSTKDTISQLIDRHPFGDEGELEVSVPVEGEGVNRGRLILSRPLRSVNAFIWSERKKLTIGAMIIAAIMVLLGWWLAQKLTGSLERLAAYAAAVRDGQDVSPPASRALEIAEVGEAMEGMRRALEGKAYVEYYTQNLAHELKAPLSAVRAAVELLEEDLPAEARAKFLRNLRTESGRIQEIIDRMLRLAALESQLVLETVETLKIDQLGLDSIAALEAEAAGMGVTVIWVSGDAGVVKGERFLLQQAVTNLIQNAIEFAPVASEVRVGARRLESQIEIYVEDRGPGVPDFAQGRIFERFFSLPRPRSGRKSTGLGLCLVREIVKLHKGEMGLENRSEGGARSWIRLPNWRE